MGDSIEELKKTIVQGRDAFPMSPESFINRFPSVVTERVDRLTSRILATNLIRWATGLENFPPEILGKVSYEYDTLMNSHMKRFLERAASAQSSDLFQSLKTVLEANKALKMYFVNVGCSNLFVNYAVTELLEVACGFFRSVIDQVGCDDLLCLLIANMTRHQNVFLYHWKELLFRNIAVCQNEETIPVELVLTTFGMNLNKLQQPVIDVWAKLKESDVEKATKTLVEDVVIPTLEEWLWSPELVGCERIRVFCRSLGEAGADDRKKWTETNVFDRLAMGSGWKIPGISGRVWELKLLQRYTELDKKIAEAVVNKKEVDPCLKDYIAAAVQGWGVSFNSKFWGQKAQPEYKQDSKLDNEEFTRKWSEKCRNGRETNLSLTFADEVDVLDTINNEDADFRLWVYKKLAAKAEWYISMRKEVSKVSLGFWDRMKIVISEQDEVLARCAIAFGLKHLSASPGWELQKLMDGLQQDETHLARFEIQELGTKSWQLAMRSSVLYGITMASLQKESVVDDSPRKAIEIPEEELDDFANVFAFNDTVGTIFDWIGFLLRRFLTDRSENSLAQSIVTLPAAMRLMNTLYREKPSPSFLPMLLEVLSRDGDIPFNKLFRRLKVIDRKLSMYYIRREQREALDIFLSWFPQVEREVVYNKAKPLDGIITYLTHKCGGNVHENDVVEVKGSSVYESGGIEHAAKNAVDLGSDSSFQSKDQSKSWIRYDFKNFGVMLTSYSIRTAASGAPKSWVLEVSNDSEGPWEEVDRRGNNGDLKGQYVTANFQISASQHESFRFVRLRQTDKNRNGSNSLCLSSLELFGTLSSQ